MIQGPIVKIFAKITSDAASTQTQLSNVSAKNQQFDSVVDEIRTVSIQNRQDVNNLTVLVSKLENKMRNESEKCFAKVTNDVEILERKTQKISQLMENFESRIKARFQEIGSLLNMTDIFSEENITDLSSDTRNCQFSVDNDDTTLESDLSGKMRKFLSGWTICQKQFTIFLKKLIALTILLIS